MRALRAIVATILLGPLVLMLAAPDAQDRLVNRRDADRIFGLNRAQWEAEAQQFVPPQGWSVRLSPVATGTGVIAMDLNTGMGLGIQPLFREPQGPPEMLVVGSYYPAGTFRQFNEQVKRDMEAATSTDLGQPYSVNVTFTSVISPPPGFDVIEVIITRGKR
jgi:hypothetical protein